jgi:initiation factor 1A
MLGANRVKIQSVDGKTRMGRIRAKMKKRAWLLVGDVIVMVPWSFQDDKRTSCGDTKERKLSGSRRTGTCSRRETATFSAHQTTNDGRA